MFSVNSWSPVGLHSQPYWASCGPQLQVGQPCVIQGYDAISFSLSLSSSTFLLGSRFIQVVPKMVAWWLLITPTFYFIQLVTSAKIRIPSKNVPELIFIDLTWFKCLSWNQSLTPVGWNVSTGRLWTSSCCSLKEKLVSNVDYTQTTFIVSGEYVVCWRNMGHSF